MEREKGSQIILGVILGTLTRVIINDPTFVI